VRAPILVRKCHSSQSICSGDETEKYKRMIGQSMGCMLLDVINPIVELYPDLKPPRLE
jgi:hypothetical protein